MDALFTMLSNVLLFMALAIPGFILSKTKLVKNTETNVLSTILLYVGTPFLIVKNLISIKFTVSVIYTLIFTTIITAIFIPVCYFLTKLLISKNLSKETKGATIFASIMSNSGFLGIPLASSVFPNQPYLITIITCICIVNVMYITSLGNYCISNNKKDISVIKIVISPFTISFLLGIILNLVNVFDYVPLSDKFVNELANVVSPLSMIVLGLKVGEVSFKNIFFNVKLIPVSIIKLILQPMVIVGILLLLNLIIPIEQEVIIGSFIIFAMPSATLGISYIDRYNGDIKNGVSYTLGSTILSIITLPLLYFLVISII